MPNIKLNYWTIEGNTLENNGKCPFRMNGASLKYNKIITATEPVDPDAYAEIEAMFGACLDSAAMVFHKTMLSPKNTKPQNRRFELRAFVLSEWIARVEMMEEQNAKSS